jgi:hypothetical protein
MADIRLAGGRHRAATVACAAPLPAQRAMPSAHAGERRRHRHGPRAAGRGAARTGTVTVLWLRAGAGRVAHAFLEIDVSAGFVAIEPVGPCGKYRVDGLQNDASAQRCRQCQRAIRELR